MKKERSNRQCKGLYETLMNNYTAIKWITWKKWTDSKVLFSKTEPGRNRNDEQPNYKH